MRSVVDERLKAEVARYRLRFSCDDCVHFDPAFEPETGAEAERDGAQGRCSQGFPVGEHRASSLEGRSDVVFCKMFEAS